jgi:hypothetical protein
MINNTKLLPVTILILISTFTHAVENRIEISSEPALPFPNLVKNGSFPNGSSSWKKSSDLCNVSNKEGSESAQISGNKDSKPNISQSIKLEKNIPAGSPVYISLLSRTEDCDTYAKPPQLSCLFYYSNGEKAYLPTPFIPVEPHDWVKCERVIKNKYPVKAISLSLCYYNQTGKSYWDDITIKAGNTKLNCNITGKDIKQVKIFSSIEGLIYESKILPGVDSYKKSLEVPGYATYYVQLETSSGEILGKRYPENENVPQKSTADSITLFKRFDSEVIGSGQKRSYSAELPDITSKNVFLEVTARLDSLKEVAGFTPALVIEVNGQKLTVKDLHKRKERFTRSCGAVSNVMGAGLFIVYYSPWFYSLNADNKYCPVDIPDMNPFIYKFKINGLVKPGKNKFIIGNLNRNKTRDVTMFLKNCRIYISDK